MRYYRFFSDVREMPIKFDILGFRVTTPVILILISDILVSTLIIVIGNQFLEGTGFTILVAVAAFIGIVIAGIILWWVSKLTRMGPLPVEKQLRLLKESADLPVWTGLDYIDNDKKEQIR